MPRVCILFHSIPIGTNYLKGHYSMVEESKAREYVQHGYGVLYDPKNKSIAAQLPDNLPGRDQFIAAGITTMEVVNSLTDFTEIPGIGKATEKKIIEYLNVL